MVLGPQGPGRVGRRRFISHSEPPERRLAAFSARRLARRGASRRPSDLRLAAAGAAPPAVAGRVSAPRRSFCRVRWLMDPQTRQKFTVPALQAAVRRRRRGAANARRQDAPGPRAAGARRGPVGPPGGGPALSKLAATRPAGSVLPDLTAGRARGSGPPACRPMHRREADLCAWLDHPWPARARGTTDTPAVRVLARHGGGRRRRHAAGERGCLTQGGEREGRVDGPPQQLAERALGHAAGGRRGEHVFGKLRPRPDGTAPPRRTGVPDRAAPRNSAGSAATDLAWAPREGARGGPRAPRGGAVRRVARAERRGRSEGRAG
jgi:hypothetical protein